MALIVLNLGLLVSTVLLGVHYLVDVIGGIALFAVNRAAFGRLWERQSRGATAPAGGARSATWIQ